MPAAPDAVAPATLVIRPRRLRLVASSFAVALVLLTLYGWFALPAEIQVLFTLSQRLTLLGVLAVLVGVMVLLALSVVRADADGLWFRNGLRTPPGAVGPGAPGDPAAAATPGPSCCCCPPTAAPSPPTSTRRSGS